MQVLGASGTVTRDQRTAKGIAQLPRGAIEQTFEQRVSMNPDIAQEKAISTNEVTNSHRVADTAQQRRTLARRAYESLREDDKPLASEDVMRPRTSSSRKTASTYRRWLELEVQHRVPLQNAPPEDSAARRAETRNRAARRENQTGWQTLRGLTQQSHVDVGPVVPRVDLNRVVGAMENFAKAIEDYLRASGQAFPASTSEATPKPAMLPAALAALPPPLPGRLETLTQRSW
jgi:hypothetical protein